MLQCHLCKKPFTSTSSHTRHVRYCLRTRNKPRVRQKSCRACSASKVKCTFQRPSCARCHKKGVECVYDGDEVPNQPAAAEEFGSQVVVPEPEQGTIEPWQLELTSTDQPGPIDWTAMDLFLPPEFSTPNITGINTETIQPLLSYPDSSTGDLRLQSAAFSTPPSLLTQTILPSTTSNTIALSDGRTARHEPSISPQNLAISPYPSLPPPLAHPTILTPLTAHDPKSCPNSAAQFSITSIIRGLRSYPLMMLQKETFPPLIHPHLLDMHNATSSSFPDNNSYQAESPTSSLPSSNLNPTPSSIISKCMSIAHLYALRTPETTPHLWDAILEQTNFFASHLSTLPPASLISAIQAQLIYVIMRIITSSSSSSLGQPSNSDPRPQSHSLNLSYSIMHVFKSLCETYVLKFGTEEMYYHAYMAPSSPPPPGFIRDVKAEWEDFIVTESWRRMKVIFWLISKIVDVNMGASVRCTSRYADVEWIKLPCGRGEWHARDEVEWEGLRRVSQVGFMGEGGVVRRKLDTIGSLLGAHRGTVGSGGFGGGSDVGRGSMGCAEALDRWNAEADGLGALLNASLGMV